MAWTQQRRSSRCGRPVPSFPVDFVRVLSVPEIYLLVIICGVGGDIAYRASRTSGSNRGIIGTIGKPEFF